MALDLDDGEFWLPSEFLTDDDILMEHKPLNKEQPGFGCGLGFPPFPSERPFGGLGFSSSSALNSPVESVMGSTETESDEEDFLSGLARQMARSMLQSEIKPVPAYASENQNHKRVMSGSPQSPLCGVGSWSVSGSPNGPSQVSSPPTTPLNGKDDAWEVLYAAAGQMRMNMNERGLLGPPRKPSPSPLPPPLKNSTGLYSNQVLTHQQIQANQFHQLKQQQIQQQQQRCSSVWARQAKPAQQVPTRPVCGVYGANRCGGGGNRPLGLPVSAWPPLQQQSQNGSGMRAVFLGGSGTRRESNGTGVFLPRQTGKPSDTRKKPGCSTVLLPARVVQALNLNFEDMNGGVGGVNGAAPRFGNGPLHGSVSLLSHQKRSFRPHQPTEVQLPQEWTY